MDPDPPNPNPPVDGVRPVQVPAGGEQSEVSGVPHLAPRLRDASHSSLLQRCV